MTNLSNGSVEQPRPTIAAAPAPASTHALPERKPHCLVVTHLGLNQLRQKNYGTYRRLSMLIEAVGALRMPCRIFCTIAPQEAVEPLPAIAARIEQELLELWRIEATVVLGVAAPPSEAPWLFQQFRALTGYAQTPLSRSLFPQASLQLLRRELEQQPALIVAHRLLSMFALTRIARDLPPTFFDLDDVEHIMVLRTLRQTASLREKFFNVLSLPALLYAERQSVRRAVRTFVCSGDDAARVRNTFRSDSIEVLPNAISMPAAVPGIASRPVLLMVGIYTYGPNADGADFFIREIFSLIRAQMPDAELWLVGKSPENLASFALRPEGVSFLGFVDDLDAVYRDARVVVCPIRYGSGTRVKLVEAAAWGKPIVSTGIGAEGLGMKDGEDAALVDDPRQFAASCLHLLRDDTACATLGKNARELALRTFDKHGIVQQLAEKFRRLAGTSAAQYAPGDPSPRAGI